MGVVYDILLRNFEPKDGTLWMIHRGDIDLSIVPEDIFNGPLSEGDICKVFLGQYSDILVGERFVDELHCTNYYGGPIYLGRQHFHDTFERVEIGKHPFSLYRMMLPSESAGWLRLKGTIEGENFSQMKESSLSFFDVPRCYPEIHEGFSIYGGTDLVGLIQKDLANHPGASNPHPQLFSDFVEKVNTPPRAYSTVIFTAMNQIPILAESQGMNIRTHGSSPFPFLNLDVSWFQMITDSFYYALEYPGFHIKIRKDESNISQNQSQLATMDNRSNHLNIPLTNDHSDHIEKVLTLVSHEMFGSPYRG